MQPCAPNCKPIVLCAGHACVAQAWPRAQQTFCWPGAHLGGPTAAWKLPGKHPKFPCFQAQPCSCSVAPPGLGPQPWAWPALPTMPWAHNHPIATNGISHPSLRPAAAPTIFRKILGSFQKCQIAKLHHRDNQARWHHSEGTFLQVFFCLELIDKPLKGPF